MSNSKTVTSAVAKVACMSTEWDVTQPHCAYETDNIVSGTVFFVRGADIGLPNHAAVGITNFHVIEDCRRTSCRVYLADGMHHDCDIMVASPQLDFALLNITFDPPGICTLAPGAHPPPGTPMMITGYPLDTTCDSCQFSYGHMSAPIGGHWLQCSLSANHGNSGGPLIELSTGHVHGICTAAPCMSEGITLALPFWAVRVSLERWRSDGDTLLRLPIVERQLDKLTRTEATIRNVPHCGVLVGKQGAACLLNALRPGDVLCGLADMPICALTQRLKTDRAGDVDLDSPVLSLLLASRFSAQVRRAGVSGILNVSIKQCAVPTAAIRELYPMWEHVPVSYIGGAVCLPFCKNVLDGFDGYDESERLRHCWHTWDKRTNFADGRVVIVHVQGHTHADDVGIEPLMLLKSINGTIINSVSDVECAMGKVATFRNTTPVKLEFDNRTITMLAGDIVADTELMAEPMSCQ